MKATERMLFGELLLPGVPSNLKTTVEEMNEKIKSGTITSKELNQIVQSMSEGKFEDKIKSLNSG
jgi:molybdopterin-biosynthesis enzyme MoeA-like protein